MWMQIPLWDSDLISFGCIPRSGMAGSSLFNFLRNLHTVSHGGILHSDQQYTSVPFSPYSHQHLVSLSFLKTAIQKAGGDISQWLVCISLVTSDVQHLFMYLLTMLAWSLKVILCLALLCHPPYICSCYSKLGLGVERGLTSWRGFPGGAVVKNLPANAGDTRDERDMRSIPGLGRSPGEGNGNLLQYSCLGNPVDRGAWWATVHGVSRRTEDAHVSFLEASFILILSTCSTVDPWASRAPSFTDFSSIYLYLVNYKRARASTSARVQSCAAAAADF